MTGSFTLNLQTSGGKLKSNPVFLTSGSYGHGNPLVITSPRMGFGSKGISSPAIWDNFQSATVGNSVESYNSAWVRYNGPQSLPGGARISTDHARYAGSKAAFNDSANGFSTNWRTFTPTRTIYASHWAYLECVTPDTGTMTSTTVNSFTCTGKNWATNYWAGCTVTITAGKGDANNGNIMDAQILSNTADTITLNTSGTAHGGWWKYGTLSSGTAGVDIPFTVESGEASVSNVAGGDTYGAWTSTGGVMRVGYRIRVRPTANGVNGVVKVGDDLLNPLLTVTAVQPDNTSVFRLAPHCQLKQHRLMPTPASGGGASEPNYGAYGTHALTSWHFEEGNSNILMSIFDSGLADKNVACPINEWYRVETKIYVSDVGVPNGYYQIRITPANGTRSINTFSGVINRPNGYNWLIDEYLLGLMFANVITTTVKAYSTDVYVDNDSWSRFEIGNAATYSACTILETQPFTSWSNSSVTITQNFASIPGNKYLYFIDANDTPSVGMLLAGA